MLGIIADIASDVTTIVALAVILIKPIRERIFGWGKIKEGQKCLLRSEIVRTYYRHLNHKELRQYEYENLCLCYNAYTQLGGNSFITHIYEEMQEWTVVQ